MFKYNDTQYTSLTPDKILNSLMYRTLFYLNIYGSYKFLKTVWFFGPLCIWTKVYEILGRCRRPIATSKAISWLSESCFVSKMFAVKFVAELRSRRKTWNIADSRFRWRGYLKFLHAFLNLAHFRTYVEVWLSFVQWAPPRVAGETKDKKQAFRDIRLRPGRGPDWSTLLSAAATFRRRAHYVQTRRHP